MEYYDELLCWDFITEHIQWHSRHIGDLLCHPPAWYVKKSILVTISIKNRTFQELTLATFPIQIRKQSRPALSSNVIVEEAEDSWRRHLRSEEEDFFTGQPKRKLSVLWAHPKWIQIGLLASMTTQAPVRTSIWMVSDSENEAECNGLKTYLVGAEVAWIFFLLYASAWWAVKWKGDNYSKTFTLDCNYYTLKVTLIICCAIVSQPGPSCINYNRPAKSLFPLA